MESAKAVENPPAIAAGPSLTPAPPLAAAADVELIYASDLHASAGLAATGLDGPASAAGVVASHPVKKRFRIKFDAPDLIALAVFILAIGAVVVALGVVVLIGFGRMDSLVGAKLIGGLLGGAAITGLAGVAARGKPGKPSKQVR